MRGALGAHMELTFGSFWGRSARQMILAPISAQGFLLLSLIGLSRMNGCLQLRILCGGGLGWVCD
tara:strand:+ start:849 stop:1043 length:195 start_codon:yes stop_codon:yes gene_type:complete